MSSSDASNIEAAARISSRLAEIERSYQEAGGSTNISMVEIRAQFVEVLLFHSKNWYRHWSNFAIRLVKLDKEAGRPIFKNILSIPTTTPRSNEDKIFIFNVSENPNYSPDLSRPVSPIIGVQNSGVPATSVISPIDLSVLSSEEKIALLSKQNEANQSRLNTLLALHESGEKDKRKRHHHKKKDDSSDSSSISSTKSEKNAKKYAFIAKKKDDIPIGNFTPGALLFAADVKGYDSSISQAVKPDFPDVLTKELLFGRFIDLQRIKGELLNPKKGKTSYTASGKEKGLEILKNLTLEMGKLAEWLYYFGILKKALKRAFPDCESFISEYGKYIKSQFWSGSIMA
ncbi:hypothetical protein DFH28DRAFT_1109182 [Melampsora americana]|nr:hypothetical protein DFH28DRAFT_1109182 [Melampsora americana]